MNQAERPPAAELRLADICVGDVFRLERTFTPADVDGFAALSGDHSPLHVDAAYAEATEFGSRVVHGMLLASQFSTLVGMFVPGKHALYLGQDLAFRRPVLVGDPIVATAKVLAKNVATRTIVLGTEVRTPDGTLLVSGSGKVRVRGEEEAEPGSAPSLPEQASGKVALVTGGSGGIGAGICRELARRGVTVAVNFRQGAARARQVVDAIRDAGGEAESFGCDVRDEAEVKAMVEAIVGRFGGIQMVVNGAVGRLDERPVRDLGWADLEASVELQLRGVLNVCQAAHPHLAQGGGSIVNLLSQVVRGPVPRGMSAYAVAKYALLGLSRSLATEWAPDGIRVNTVSPGLVETELTEHYHERMFKMEASRTPLKRLARPDDVAHAVAYLLGQQSSFVTGIDLPLTGGQVMS